jgi:pimeloyl-ACP methyl ester carboxylesterase
VVDWANVVGQWLLSQLEMMPLPLLRQGAELRTPGRLVDYILGEREAEEVRALLSRPLGDRPRVATVLLPGIMGSLLASVRGISTLIWVNPAVISNGHINLLDLDDDGVSDRSPDVEIVPIGVEKLTYLKLVITLARETRLYEFPYDWRRHLEWNADLLHQCIARWSANDPTRRFVLVGHSMGGMVARTYLARYPQEAADRIERVIMLGTPLHGAAIAALIFTGQTPPSRVVAKLHPDNDVIRFASNLPSTYQMLPPPPELFPSERPYPVNWDLYDAAAWRLPHVRQRYLNDARSLHALLASSDPQVALYEIAGCHRRTPTDVHLGDDTGAHAEGRPEYRIREGESGADSGDEWVPLWSVTHAGVQTYYVEESHQALPSNSRVLEAVMALVQGAPCPLSTALPEPSGFLDALRAAPLIQQVTELREHLEAGHLKREDLAKIFFAR